MSMLGQLAPTKGQGLTGIPRPMGTPMDLGSVLYARTQPNASYALANGATIKAADYPAYARQFAPGPGHYTQRLADPGTMPIANPSAYASAISPDGVYAAVTRGTGGTFVNLYKLADDAITFLQTLTVTGDVGGPEAMAFSPDGEYIAIGCTSAPYLYIYRRNAGTDVFNGTAVTLSGTALSAVPNAIDIADDNAVMLGYANSGFGYGAVYTVVGTLATRVGGNFPGSLPGPPRQFVRNKAGTRYAVRVAEGPTYTYLYDYAGSGVLTPASVTVNANGAPNNIAMSPSGDYLAMVEGDTTQVRIYRNPTGAQFTTAKPVGTPAISSTLASITYTPDDRQMIVSGGPTTGYAVYQPANGQYFELARGNVPNHTGTFAQRKLSRNGKLMLGVSSTAPYFSVYSAAPTMADVPLPALPTRGGGDAPLNPYVRVR